MADLVSYGNPERDIEQALITLKKGTQLVKYSRKGKPKFCPFRISTDETTLIWYSHGKERNLKLSTISRIIPGQRTAVFRRFLRPEKDYLSFSLLYNNGERSLDLICKDKVEVEVWLSGLKTLISPAQRSRRSKSDISDITDVCEFQTYRPFGASLEATSSLPRESISNFRSSDVGSSDRGNMQPRSSSADGFRISVSSAPSSSSQGSGPDDIESLGDVYIWGEVWSDSNLVEGSVNSLPSKIDVLIPKPLESNVVLDVQQIACGFRHVALLTRQGEVFTWGEESGGRLGHGIGTDLSHPQLVDYLALNNADYVACGEYHTCAVTTSGDVFTWGDGTQNTGLLGHGSDISHWTPKRVSGPLEGIQILSVSCGTWHTALVTSTGKLFTYGDGAFGVLGHGDRETVAYPREVESLSGLKTVKVACAPWHTAAIVEVMSQSGSNISSRKLFTWGDGDKYRLGHGDKEPKLVPTCVPSLIDYNFYNLACGNSITVALTTSGHVFTMGNSEYGQLGNPLSDGKTPRLVQDKLVGEFIEEISCGETHVAVLTSRNEVLTWGRGANGRLGHGDHEDRKSPTLVEALKDRHVKSISCGSNFTACICIHKWVSGADQSLCSGCRQAFGFTRKRHNCYNCGLVHCHTCSSKKALKAALAPTPGKPHRVCDSCYAKLKGAESGIPTTPVTKKPVTPRKSSTDNRIDRGEVKSSRTLLSPSPDLVKFVDVKMVKPAIKPEPVPVTQGNQVQSVFQLKDMGFQSPFSALQFGLKPVNTSTPQPTPQPQAQTPSQPPMPSRPASPYRKPSPPRAATPLFSKSLIDSLKKTNELLNQEVLKLQTQVKNLKEKCQNQDVEMQKSQKEAQEAAAMAAMVTEEASSGRVAKEFIKTIAAQFKEMKETLPAEVCEIESFKSIQSQLECMVKTKESQSSEFYSSLPADCLEPDQQNDTTISDSSQRGEGSKQYENKESDSNERNENGSKTPIYTEVTEQFEPGVYITLSIRNGTRIFKRVRFSKKRFVNQQAEEWWKENKDRVLKRYNYPVGNDSAPTASSSNSAPNEDEEAAPPS